jgi:hypothetical protein
MRNEMTHSSLLPRLSVLATLDSVGLYGCKRASQLADVFRPIDISEKLNAQTSRR